MKVKDLIDKLESFDPDIEVMFISEQEDIVPENYLVRVMELLEIKKSKAHVSRDNNGIVSPAFGESKDSREWLFFQLTSDI